MNSCTDQIWKHIFRYEFALASAFGWIPFFVLKTILQTFYHANIDYLRNWETFVALTGIGFITLCTADACYSYLWINILGFFPPKPFGGYTIGSIIIFVVYTTLWFRIPKSARREKELKRKFVIFLVSRVYDILVSWVYVYFTLLFILIPSDYQPILGLVCPLLRDILLKILNFITYNVGGGKHVKMGKYFLDAASSSGSNITILCEMKILNFS